MVPHFSFLGPSRAEELQSCATGWIELSKQWIATSASRTQETAMKMFSALSFNSALLTGALLFVPMAYAAETAVDREFMQMDSNADGKMSPDEHAAGAKKMFGMMDADADGKVTAAEMDAAQQSITGEKAKPADMSSAEKINAVDADGDGLLTTAEHSAASIKMFETMDGDKDGLLTKDELAAGHAAMMKKP
jgi:Ca2+-binding EF-hand superfamily protein